MIWHARSTIIGQVASRLRSMARSSAMDERMSRSSYSMLRRVGGAAVHPSGDAPISVLPRPPVVARSKSNR